MSLKQLSLNEQHVTYHWFHGCLLFDCEVVASISLVQFLIFTSFKLRLLWLFRKIESLTCQWSKRTKRKHFSEKYWMDDCSDKLEETMRHNSRSLSFKSIVFKETWEAYGMTVETGKRNYCLRNFFIYKKTST